MDGGAGGEGNGRDPRDAAPPGWPYRLRNPLIECGPAALQVFQNLVLEARKADYRGEDASKRKQVALFSPGLS